eukprot:s227_g32.t1
MVRPMGRLIRCMVPAAPEMPQACEIHPSGNCDPIDDLAVPVSIAGYATEIFWNYSSAVTSVVTGITPERSAAMSGMVFLTGFGFPVVSRAAPFTPPAPAKHMVLHIGTQSCRIEESTPTSLSCFLIRHPPMPSGKSRVQLWILGWGFALVTPGVFFSHAFAVTQVSPSSGSWHGGALLDIGGRGFHPEIFRQEVVIRLTLQNGTIQDLPCPLVPTSSLQSRRLQCQAPALSEPLLEYIRTSQEESLDEALAQSFARHADSRGTTTAG